MSLSCYVIHSQFKQELKQEIGQLTLETPELIFSESLVSSIWAQDVFKDIKIVEIQSIKEAARILQAQAPIWHNLSQSHHRRSQLIQENLRSYKVKPLQFMEKREFKKIGVWGLLDQNQMFYSTDLTCPIPGGKIEFNEDKDTSPSRAYLKLWELFTVYGIHPNKDEVVIDMGSCPGGWSWVLSDLCKKVYSVDKAPLDPRISIISNIEFLKKDAIKLEPSEVTKVDWFFSDIICEPVRLLELIKKWDGFVDNFVCTVKFKGATDFEAIKKFQELNPNRILHLYNNKHEITFVKLKKS